MSKEDLIKHQFTTDQSRTEAARNGRKGGKASGKSRRRRRTLREDLERLLADTIDTPRGRMTMQEAISTGLLTRAAKGDPNAYKIIRDTLGETLPEKVQVSAAPSEFDVRDLPDDILFAAAEKLQEAREKRRREQDGVE